MSRPRFSEFLSNRRRQLGLSIAQAARVLKLKDQVLVAFEEGDWDRIPRAGYAQGMLSSYARYLGLNPREVIDLFQEDLHAYNESQASGGRRMTARTDAYGDDPLYELPNTTASSPRAHTPGPGTDKDLYGSAGPAGSIISNNSVSGTYLNNGTPLVSGRAAGYSDRYLAENGIDPTTGQRRYTTRSPQSSRSSSQRASRQRQQPQRSSRAQDTARRMSTGAIETRRASFDDDLRYDRASGYESASSSEGRSASHNIARPDRPNVRRRASSQQRSRASQSKPPKSGVAGVIEAWFSDQRRTILTVFVLVAIILILVITFSVRSCVRQDTSTAKEDTVSTVATTAASGTSTETGNTGSSATTDTSSTATADTDDSTATTDANTPVTVDVKLDDGAVAWVEVLNGGKSLVAGTQTGPWEQSYTVDGTLTVRTDDPTAVTVTANGDAVKFDTMVSGIGTATVEGPSSDTDDTSSDSSTADSSTSDGSSTDSTTSTSSQ